MGLRNFKGCRGVLYLARWLGMSIPKRDCDTMPASLEPGSKTLWPAGQYRLPRGTLAAAQGPLRGPLDAREPRARLTGLR